MSEDILFLNNGLVSTGRSIGQVLLLSHELQDRAGCLGISLLGAFAFLFKRRRG